MKPKPQPHLLELEPYKPGRPIEEVERELGLSGTIKLASNENPLGPSPRAVAALRAAAERVHFYPESGGPALVAKLADQLGVTRSMIVLGNGSNELIELLARAFAAPGEEIVMSADAFLVYRIVAHAIRAKAVAVAPRDGHHDLDAIAGAIGPRTRIVFLANPNNPTGTIFRREAFERFIERVPPEVLVVVDQAYCEYVDDETYPKLIDRLAALPSIVLLRTFSKIYGLAGLRIGYAVGHPDVISVVARLRQPFNVSSLAQVAAAAALDDFEHVERSRDLNREIRRALEQGLDALGLAYLPSQANFVLADVGDGARVTAAMLAEGVIVRPMDAYGMPSKIRITCGTAEQNERALAALALALGKALP